MSDKISDKRLEWIRASYVASSKGHAFALHPSYDEEIAIIDELLALRKAATPVAWVSESAYLLIDKYKEKERVLLETTLWFKQRFATDIPLYNASQPAPAVVLPEPYGVEAVQGEVHYIHHKHGDNYDREEIHEMLKAAGITVNSAGGELLALRRVTPSDAAKVARGFGYVTNGQASDIEDALEMVAKGVSPLEAVNKIEANDEEES